MRVGFIGVGNQGGPMARRVALSGEHDLTLWARRPASLEPYADTPARSAATPAELAAASELISICVVADDDVRQVVTGPDGVLAGAARDTIVAIHSTVSPALVTELAERAAADGVHVIDAPVSGGAVAAEAGELAVMVGASAELFERGRPAFLPYANPLVHVGPLGSGILVKLLNNALMATNLGIARDVVELARGLGVDPDAALRVITSGSGTSYSLGAVQRAGLSLGTMARARLLLTKDVGLLVDAAAVRGADPAELVARAEHGLEWLRQDGDQYAADHPDAQ
jgi:3-hydroxyisobutyrate dehydrogenase-like beta-hydroxyacid dehydrogenase